MGIRDNLLLVEGKDDPGRQLHDAIKQAMLDASHPYAAPFVAWFKALYELP